MLEKTAQAIFFSLIIDGSSDKANIGIEVFVVVWCDTNRTDKIIHKQTTYFRDGRPSTVDASGLFQNLSDACNLKRLGFVRVDANHCSKMVGIGI